MAGCPASGGSIRNQELKRDVIFDVWHRRGRANLEGDAGQQGMGIKSALILNYSREKNPRPERSAGRLWHSVISAPYFLRAGESGVYNNGAGLLLFSCSDSY